MDDEINSKFQEECVITEKLMGSKLVAMEKHLHERIVQVIQEQFSIGNWLYKSSSSRDKV